MRLCVGCKFRFGVSLFRGILFSRREHLMSTEKPVEKLATIPAGDIYPGNALASATHGYRSHTRTDRWAKMSFVPRASKITRLFSRRFEARPLFGWSQTRLPFAQRAGSAHQRQEVRPHPTEPLLPAGHIGLKRRLSRRLGHLKLDGPYDRARRQTMVNGDIRKRARVLMRTKRLNGHPRARVRIPLETMG